MEHSIDLDLVASPELNMDTLIMMTLHPTSSIEMDPLTTPPAAPLHRPVDIDPFETPPFRPLSLEGSPLTPHHRPIQMDPFATPPRIPPLFLEGPPPIQRRYITRPPVEPMQIDPQIVLPFPPLNLDAPNLDIGPVYY